MNHMEDNNANAHAVSPGHITNPLIIIHVTCMVTAYGVLMPIGIMLGIRRHKVHIPLMTAAVIVALAGYFFGYFHHLFGIGEGVHDEDGGHEEAAGGDMAGMPGMRKRQVGDTSAEHYGWAWKITAHGAMANLMLLLLFVQVGMGVYRKFTKGRPRLQFKWLSGSVPRKVHSYLGKAHLVMAYIQMVLGCILLIEACPGQYFGQCISHIVMGGSFWWYGGIYIAYLVGSFPGVSRPEWYESLIMTVWGVINFSILHQWGTRWSHADLQHTSLGLLWVGGGALSLMLESKFNPLAQFIIRKNPIPALLIILTGYAMGQHAQYYMFATMVHTFFGYCLMLGGVCRLIQLALRPAVSPMGSSKSTTSAEDDDDTTTLEDEDLQDKANSRSRPQNLPGLANGETPVSAFFGFLSALGLVSAGLLFQSAHEEQLNIMMYYLTDASTYINWIMSFSFFCITYMLFITQIGKKRIGEQSSTSKAYNRLRTHVNSEDRTSRQLSSHDIEMSGFLDVDE
ncbi:hypothetical protein EMPS_01473 [Entomortierella parvispora]|uniref:Protein YTP1-like C-terminal domain-containing protein n=1 Tax=Entomortierella parvispora TaxID=205924 RepID=A0A9P3LSU4_9FUNG|nr:hypothetical protein EMPS_01473 [Entomortierella parvispora]